MKWRIRQNPLGDYVAERGIVSKGGELSPTGIGYTMPGFILYELHTFKTYRQAEKYIQKNKKKGDIF